jgi:predicted metal-binding membrane protein
MTSNTQEPRSREAIVLGLTGNFLGTYKFMNLNTGCLIKCRKFKKY